MSLLLVVRVTRNDRCVAAVVIVMGMLVQGIDTLAAFVVVVFVFVEGVGMDSPFRKICRNSDHPTPTSLHGVGCWCCWCCWS